MAGTSSIGEVVGDIVSLMSRYMSDRVGVSNAAQNQPDAEMLRQSEQTMNIVRTGVSQYGSQDEKAVLARFERDPQRSEGDIRRVLTDIAMRTPVFRQELESLVWQFKTGNA